MSYPWYKSVPSTEKVAQGDIILDLIVPAPQPDLAAVQLMKTAYKRKNVIVMTQACDLEQRKVNSVKVCAIIPLKDFIQTELIASEITSRRDKYKGKEEEIDTSPISIDYGSTKVKKRIDDLLKKLRTGGFIDLYLLNEEFSIGNFNASIVNLREEYSLPLITIDEFIKKQDNPRLRLQPPYREHLNQSYVNLYSRIGLPQDINVGSLKLDYDNNFKYEDWVKII